MQIELPDEIVEFMRDLAREISEQDNRATRSPYYYVVMASEEHAAADGCGDEVGYYDEDVCESFSSEDVERQYDQEREDGDVDPEETFQEWVDSRNFRTYDIGYHDREENVFLTFRGYKKHMKMNGHNYGHLKKVRSYVKYCHRNPEMEGLLKAIMAFKALPTEQNGGN